MFIFQYKKYVYILYITSSIVYFILYFVAPISPHLLILDRYSPTILLLRHFDVFRNLASHEGSPNDHMGITSEVASVIREFTEPVSEDGEIDSKGKLNGEFVRHIYFTLTLSCFKSFYYIILHSFKKYNWNQF